MPDETYINPAILTRAAIGRVILVAETDEAPEHWHECDGSVQASFRWPLFVRDMGITEATFTLPKPERVAEGKKFIIKLGPRSGD